MKLLRISNDEVVYVNPDFITAIYLDKSVSEIQKDRVVISLVCGSKIFVDVPKDNAIKKLDEFVKQLQIRNENYKNEK